MLFIYILVKQKILFTQLIKNAYLLNYVKLLLNRLLFITETGYEFF